MNGIGGDEHGGAVFPSDAAVVQGESAVGGRGVVKDGHACVAHEDEALFFDRLEPAAKDMGFQAFAKIQPGQRGVGARGAERVMAGAGNGRGRAAGEADEHGDVVWREAPERVFLGADFAEIQPVRMQAKEAAEAAGGGEFAERGEGGVIFEQVVHLEDAAEAVSLGYHLGTVGEFERHGFLDEEVLAGAEQSQSERVMGGGWGGQGDGVDVGPRHKSIKIVDALDSGSDVRGGGAAGWRGVNHKAERAERVKVANQIFPPIAAAYDGDAG